MQTQLHKMIDNTSYEIERLEKELLHAQIKLKSLYEILAEENAQQKSEKCKTVAAIAKTRWPSGTMSNPLSGTKSNPRLTGAPLTSTSSSEPE